MTTIKLSFKNYKKLQNFETIKDDVKILLVTGKNEIGKSTLFRGIAENLSIKATTPQPVTTNQSNGSKTITVPDVNGNPITIVHEFSVDNNKGTFYAIDYTGKRINDVSKMRSLIGIYEEMSIDRFYTLAETAEGRRKIIDTFFYPLLDPISLAKIKNIDKEVSKTGNLYLSRTAINKDIERQETILKSTIVTKEDKVLVDNLPQLKSHLNALQESKQAISQKMLQQELHKANIKAKEDKIISLTKAFNDEIQRKESYVYEKSKQMEELQRQLREIQIAMTSALDDFDKSLDDIKNDMDTQSKELNTLIKIAVEDKVDEDSVSTNFNDEIKETTEFIERANNSLSIIKSQESIKNILINLRKEQEELNTKINNLRQEKIDILKNSKLPGGLIIEEDNFTWNGYEFNGAQISTSRALLIISELICKLVGSKIVYIGERRLFDDDNLKKLIQIAEANGKIPMLEEVVTGQNEIVLITEVEDI